MDLNPDVIFRANRSGLGSAGAGRRRVGCEGEVRDVVESTMDTARRLAAAGAPDGYVVLAEEQRSGRGRTGVWQCGRGDGLLMSVVLRIGLPAGERRMLSLMGAVAAAEAVIEFGVEARIKWPNDVVVAEKPQGPVLSGGEGPVLSRAEGLRLRKLGGVLVEPARRSSQGGAGHVLGIGLNVNQDRRRLPAVAPGPPYGGPATSVKIELGRAVDRSELCRVLLERLDHWYGKLRMAQPEALLARWRSLSCLLGETVCAEAQGRRLTGKVVGLRVGGELALQLPDGREVVLRDHEAKLVF